MCKIKKSRAPGHHLQHLVTNARQQPSFFSDLDLKQLLSRASSTTRPLHTQQPYLAPPPLSEDAPAVDVLAEDAPTHLAADMSREAVPSVLPEATAGPRLRYSRGLRRPICAPPTGPSPPLPFFSNCFGLVIFQHGF